MLDIIISIFTDPGFAKGFFAGAIQQIQEIVGPWSETPTRRKAGPDNPARANPS